MNQLADSSHINMPGEKTEDPQSGLFGAWGWENGSINKHWYPSGVLAFILSYSYLVISPFRSRGRLDIQYRAKTVPVCWPGVTPPRYLHFRELKPYSGDASDSDVSEHLYPVPPMEPQMDQMDEKPIKSSELLVTQCSPFVSCSQCSPGTEDIPRHLWWTCSGGGGYRFYH